MFGQDLVEDLGWGHRPRSRPPRPAADPPPGLPIPEAESVFRTGRGGGIGRAYNGYYGKSDANPLITLTYPRFRLHPRQTQHLVG
jgi:hypothetical protein